MKPTFGPNKRLARWIKPEYRQGNRRASVPAFMDEYPRSRGLSVNSLEINTENEIAAIFSEKFQSGSGPVAVTIHTIAEYNAAAEKVELMVQRNETPPPTWVHNGREGVEESYRHAPSARDRSHCEVAYTPLLKEEEKEFNFAHKLARSPTYKLFET